MPNFNTEDPIYQKAIRKRENVPPWLRAIVTTADIDAAFAGERERRDIESEGRKASMGLRKAGLEERKRSNIAGESVAREKLSYGRRQADVATGISVAGLGVSALGGVVELQSAAEREAFIDEKIAKFKAMGNYTEADAWEQIKILKSYEITL